MDIVQADPAEVGPGRAPAPKGLPTSMTFFFPAYNEEGNLAPLVEKALKVLPGFVPDFDIVIVDDGSRDGTETEARALEVEHPEVRYVRHPQNLGDGEALRAGFKACRGEGAFYTDGANHLGLGEFRLAEPVLRGATV